MRPPSHASREPFSMLEGTLAPTLMESILLRWMGVFRATPGVMALLALGLTACGPQPEATSAPEGAPPSSTAAPEASSGPRADDAAAMSGAKTGHVAGVVFEVPPTWSLVNEGEIAVAKSPEGDAGFVVASFADASNIPKGLARAEREFKTTYAQGMPASLKQVPVGSLPLGFTTNHVERREGDRSIHSTWLNSRSPAGNPFTIYLWASLSASNIDADRKAMGKRLDGILATFALEDAKRGPGL